MNKTGTFGIAIIILCSINFPLIGIAEDYQYQYFVEDKKYTPFSDYIPKVRHHFYTVPHYVEDFYLLYGLKQYYNENTLRRNIDRLKTALRCKFRHPSQAFIQIDSEEEYYKYRNLLFMHINMLILRDHLKIAARYDKRRLPFHSIDFAKDIYESLTIAEKLYKEALPYWREAVKYAHKASQIKLTLDMGELETERYRIVKGDLNFENIINKYLTSLEEKKEILKKMIDESQKK